MSWCTWVLYCLGCWPTLGWLQYPQMYGSFMISVRLELLALVKSCYLMCEKACYSSTSVLNFISQLLILLEMFDKISHNQTYDTCVQASPKIKSGEKKTQDLGGSWTHNHHNSGVTAVPVELPSPWEQGSGELGIVYKCSWCLMVYSPRLS